MNTLEKELIRDAEVFKQKTFNNAREELSKSFEHCIEKILKEKKKKFRRLIWKDTTIEKISGNIISIRIPLPDGFCIPISEDLQTAVIIAVSRRVRDVIKPQMIFYVDCLNFRVSTENWRTFCNINIHFSTQDDLNKSVSYFVKLNEKNG